MAYYRDCVPRGETVTLRAVFGDGCGLPQDVDAGFPDIYLYDPDNIPADIEAEVAAGFPGAVATIESAAVVHLATGMYEITYDVVAGAVEGTWIDIWHAQINGIEVFSSFTFVVEEKGTVALQTLTGNSLIVILLDESIADTDGNTLAEETQLTFSTTYDPYYASPDLLRLECGTWLSSIPDDTLSLMIHWSSLEADAVTPTTTSSGTTNQNLLDVARTKFCVYDAAMRCLMLPTDVGGKTKRLGDLMIQDDSSFTGVIDELRDSRDEWWRVVNARGTIVPGQGFAPTFAIKGINDPDRRNIGRLWHDPRTESYDQPTQNTKYQGAGRRFRFGYKKRT